MYRVLYLSACPLISASLRNYWIGFNEMWHGITYIWINEKLHMAERIKKKCIKYELLKEFWWNFIYSIAINSMTKTLSHIDNSVMANSENSWHFIPVVVFLAFKYSLLCFLNTYILVNILCRSQVPAIYAITENILIITI